MLIKNKIKTKAISIILGIIGMIAFDILIKFITGKSFILQVIKAL